MHGRVSGVLGGTWEAQPTVPAGTQVLLHPAVLGRIHEWDASVLRWSERTSAAFFFTQAKLGSVP